MILKFLSEKWFDVLFLLLVLCLEWKSKSRTRKFEKKVNLKLRKIKEEIEEEFDNILFYSIEDFVDASNNNLICSSFILFMFFTPRTLWIVIIITFW